MYDSPVKVTRLEHRIDPDPGRVIARPFIPGGEFRIRGIIDRVIDIPGREARNLLTRIEEHFRVNHPEIEEILLEHFENVKEVASIDTDYSDEQKRLIGAYFTMEYAIEAAALFNPSMVPAFDQSGLPEGSTRFLMSLRATGEGHISSIVFRRGVITRNNNIIIEEGSLYSRQLKVRENQVYLKKVYRLKLREIEGEVELMILVNASGRVSQLYVVSPNRYPLLEKAAARALKNSLFKAYVVDGRPVPFWVRVPIEFRLVD